MREGHDRWGPWQALPLAGEVILGVVPLAMEMGQVKAQEVTALCHHAIQEMGRVEGEHQREVEAQEALQVDRRVDHLTRAVDGHLRIRVMTLWG